jgi:hypothetical protein
MPNDVSDSLKDVEKSPMKVLILLDAGSLPNGEAWLPAKGLWQ